MDPQQQTPPDDQQMTQQDQSSQQANDQAVQSQSGHVSQVDSNTQQVQPVSVPTISREGAPIPISKSEVGVSASVPEMEISPELQKETGAEVVHETPQLTPADTQVGIAHAKESVPVSVSPSTTIALPMTQQQAQTTVQTHKKVKDSVLWFAMLILRQWQMAQKKKK